MAPTVDENTTTPVVAPAIWPVRLSRGVLHLVQDTFFITPSEIKALFATRLDWKEMELLHKMGHRVPNSLWWRPDRKRKTKKAVASSIGVALSLVLLWSNYFPLQPYSTRGNRALQVIATDLFLLLGVSMTAMIFALLFLAVFQPRSMQLRNIRHMRRRFATPAKRAQLSLRLPAWPLAAFVGIAVYVALLAPTIGVGAAPPWIVTLSAALGHARVAPIVVLPIAVEMGVARWKKHQRKREYA